MLSLCKGEALDSLLSGCVPSMLYLVVSLSCARRVVPGTHLLTGGRIKPIVSFQSAFYPIFSASLLTFSPRPPHTGAILRHVSSLLLCSPFSRHLFALHLVPGMQLPICQDSTQVTSSPQGFVSSFSVLLPPC